MLGIGESEEKYLTAHFIGLTGQHQRNQSSNRDQLMFTVSYCSNTLILMIFVFIQLVVLV